MKTSRFFTLMALVGILSMAVSSCETNKDITPQQDILPNSFSVNIPSSISNRNFIHGGSTGGRVSSDSIKGNDVYRNLGTFIAVGEEASKLVEGIVTGIKKYHIDRVLSMTYMSDDDKRTKKLVVTSAVEFEGQTWDYELTITDTDSEGQADGGKAMQIFWNKNQLIKGIAIVKPFNCDRVKNAGAGNAIFRIDYTEGGARGYDAQMEVRIAGLPLASPLDNPFAIETLHMFAGKKGEVVDVFGNSNHPNAKLFTGNAGFNWAFVASGNDAKDLGVAEVGLPPSSLNTTDRAILLKDNSIKNVFTHEILAAWPGLDPVAVAKYLKNTAAPGYFSEKQGFISGGVSPGVEWDALASRLDALTPYSPKATSELTLSFK